MEPDVLSVLFDLLMIHRSLQVSEDVFEELRVVVDLAASGH